jgi:protein phosphatase 4 regulatory subunit 3
VLRWGQGRLLEAEEESYFNTDDEEDEVPISVSSVFPKAIRKRALSTPMRPHIQRPPAVIIPSLGSLVDYDDGEDIGGSEAVEDAASFSPTRISGSPGPREIPANPRPTNGPMMTGKSTDVVPHDDPEDSLLESLVSKPDSPNRLLDIGLGAKRPRDDEDDELLAIATKAKKPTMGSGTGGTPSKEAGNPGGITIKIGGVKASDDGPKRIKLKLSSPSSTTPSPSSTGVKDGDTG